MRTLNLKILRDKGQSSLTWKTIFYILLFSSFFTILASGLQLLQAYQQDVKLIHGRMELIRHSYLDSLASSVWEVDKDQITIQLKGILSLNDIVFVHLEEPTKELSFSMGSQTGKNIISRKFPLTHALSATQTVQLGSLSVIATLENVHHRILNKVLLILATQTVKTFCVSLGIFFIIYSMLTRHLSTIAHYSRGLNSTNLDTPLVLNRKKSRQDQQDELDQVVNASNEMRLNLQHEMAEKEKVEMERNKSEAQRHKLEKRIRQAQKMEAIGTLAGGIAHDFNNILFPLMGFAEMLQEDLPPDSPLQENIKEIFLASSRAKELVSQILTFSHQHEQALKPLRIQDILKEALKLIGPSIPKTIRIHTDIDPDCGVVLADSTQIHQVIMNLATNAYHAMQPSGGQLTISLKQRQIESHPMGFTQLNPGPHALLKITDTGTGITQELMDKIFDPYFTTKPQDKGTGLGLSVVQGIVNSCKGEIHIYTEPGKGTEIHIYLPIIKQALDEEKTPALKVIPGGMEHILLVDDEKAIIRLETMMLERLGYRITSRTNSLEALEVFKATPDEFDLILSDMTMPDLTGLQLAQAIKKIRPDIPFMICSGFSEQISNESVNELGIQGYVAKPLEKRVLAQAIREVLDPVSSFDQPGSTDEHRDVPPSDFTGERDLK